MKKLVSEGFKFFDLTLYSPITMCNKQSGRNGFFVNIMSVSNRLHNVKNFVGITCSHGALLSLFFWDVHKPEMCAQTPSSPHRLKTNVNTLDLSLMLAVFGSFCRIFEAISELHFSLCQKHFRHIALQATFLQLIPACLEAKSFLFHRINKV